MPALYTKIRDQYAAKGKPYDKAQEIAARTFYRLTGKTVQQAHSAPASRGGKSAAKRREME